MKTIEIEGSDFTDEILQIYTEEILECLDKEDILDFLDYNDIADHLGADEMVAYLEFEGFTVVSPDEFPEPRFENLRDEELYEEFLLAKEKYTYEELLNRLK